MGKVHIFRDYDFLAAYQVPKSRPCGLMSFLMDAVRDFLPPDETTTLLDVGGGTNSYLVFLEGGYRKIVADSVAGSLKGMAGVETMVAALPATGLPEGMADWVSACEVIEHLPPEVYHQGLVELARLSKRFVAITSPFFQHLASGQIKCGRCGVMHQCEGHYRRFDWPDIYQLQSYFGGLVRLGFAVQPRPFWLTGLRYRLKQIRYGMRRLGLCPYPEPPFAKCPVCGAEAFHDYAGYRARVAQLQTTYWVAPLASTNGTVGEHFMAVFDRDAAPVNLP
jgi:hypothetical protein